MEVLNNAQLEILKLFKYNHSEKELLEIKQVISEHLFKKAIQMATAEAKEKGYTQETMDGWANEHFRLKSISR